MKPHPRAVAYRFALVAVLGADVACSSGTSTDDTSSAPPDFPPATSTRPDLSFFRQHAPGSGGFPTNWTTALDRVAFVDSAFGDALELPAAALAAASSQAPAQDGVNWNWPYAVTVKGQSYTGTVRGIRMGEENNPWLVTTSAPGLTPPLSNRFLLAGVATIHADVGNWSLYDLAAPQGQEQRMSIEWARHSDCSTMCLTLRRPRIADRLFYHQGETISELSYFRPDVAKQFLMWWNVRNGDGGVSVANGPIKCWDTQQRDREC